MKAITLWQPWASLVAVGVKTIETRSWSTSHRGPLAIHAGARPPETSNFGGEMGGWTVGRLDPGAPRRMWRGSGPIIDLPLGAVVATCTLTDVVPILDERIDDPHLLISDEALWIAEAAYGEDHGEGNIERLQDAWQVTDQRPYGDFTPGRYAWLLAEVELLEEPVPARGRQGLWEWAA